jgi:hypothetical protein
MLKHIDGVTVDRVSQVGRELFEMNHLAITGLGPLPARALHAYR